KVRHRALGPVEHGEPERLRRELVEPPGRMERDVEERAGRQGGRDGEAVADVAQAGTCDRRVDGQDERAVPRGPRSADELDGGVAVMPEVELEPSVAIG